MKKLLSILLTFVMVFSMTSIVAFADEPEGKITIAPTAEGATYKIYKLFDLDTYNAESSVYTYMIETNSEWREFFTTTVSQYFSIATENYTRDSKTYNIIKATSAYTDASAVNVAKAALEYAKEKNIASITIVEDTGAAYDNDKKVEFTGLPLGYYLVDTSVGALCGLTTTNPYADIAVKNNPPTITKFVQEDDIKVGNNWGLINDAAFGETVEFDVTITARLGADNYIFHDKMESGLSLDETSVVVSYLAYGQNEGEETELVANQDYNIIIQDNNIPCTFEIRFSPAICDQLKDNDSIIISYRAKVEARDELDHDGITNEAWVSYGDIISGRNQLETVHSETSTYTYGFDLVKTDAAKNMLDGAEFKLYTSSIFLAASVFTRSKPYV